MAIWYVLFLSINNICLIHVSLCTVCPNQILMGSTLDLEDTRVPLALHLPACHRLQVVPLELQGWVWVQSVNQVPQILTQLQPLGRCRDSGLELIQTLIIRITGVVSFLSC